MPWYTNGSFANELNTFLNIGLRNERVTMSGLGIKEHVLIKSLFTGRRIDIQEPIVSPAFLKQEFYNEPREMII
jgi:hypothetical protein